MSTKSWLSAQYAPHEPVKVTSSVICCVGRYLVRERALVRSAADVKP